MHARTHAYYYMTYTNGNKVKGNEKTEQRDFVYRRCRFVSMCSSFFLDESKRSCRAGLGSIETKTSKGLEIGSTS